MCFVASSTSSLLTLIQCIYRYPSSVKSTVSVPGVSVIEFASAVMPESVFQGLIDFMLAQSLPYYSVPSGIYICALLHSFHIVPSNQFMEYLVSIIFIIAVILMIPIQWRIFRIMIKAEFDMRCLITGKISTEQQKPKFAILINYREETEEKGRGRKA